MIFVHIAIGKMTEQQIYNLIVRLIKVVYWIIAINFVQI